MLLDTNGGFSSHTGKCFWQSRWQRDAMEVVGVSKTSKHCWGALKKATARFLLNTTSSDLVTNFVWKAHLVLTVL